MGASVNNSGFHIVINGQAGTVLRLGRDVIEKKIEESGIQVAGLHFPEGDDIVKLLRELKQQKAPIILGGGDGTIASAVTEFIGTSEAFGIIPMGTMNLLAKDVGVPVELDTVLAAYASGTRTVKIDVGLVNGLPFLCCAALGVVPEASEFREEKRGEADLILIPQLAMFVFQQMEKVRKLNITLDGKQRHIKAAALIVSNNPYSDEDALLAESIKKDTMQSGQMGVYTVVAKTFWQRLSLLLRLKIGGWKKEESLVERIARHVRVKTQRKTEKVTLDGEVHTLKTPLEFHVKPRSLKLIVPLKETATAAAPDIVKLRENAAEGVGVAITAPLKANG